ncbi:MAG: hypothetical protein K6B52_04310 [Clostridiales bacterium]|nr:hypothetical protein [Clostridiales bacterium]
MKKIIAVLLAVLTVCSLGVTAFAYDAGPYANDGAILNDQMKFGFGGRFWFCDTEGKTYSEKVNMGRGTCAYCGKEDPENGHDSVLIYYAAKCPECKAYNCAWNVNDFFASYDSTKQYTAPDGTKMNECSVCGYLFKEKDLRTTVIDQEAIEETEETEAVPAVTHIEFNCYMVYDGSDETFNAIKGENDTIYLGDLSLSAYEKAAKNKVVSYLLFPLLKIYHAITSIPGLALDSLLAILGVIAPDIISKFL